MNSCIYISKLYHSRLKPRENLFTYKAYMMYLDLDELGEIDSEMLLFSLNRWNIFSFFDEDHFQFLKYKNKTRELISKEKVKYDQKEYSGKNTKERIRTMVGELKLDFELGKVFVLTNLRNFGYIFNPVSFYYCFDSKGDFKALFSEVNNTFHDQKMYYIEIENSKDKIFESKQKKNYYISPFTDLENTLHWRFELPGEKLVMKIDSLKDNEVELKTVFRGKRKEITNFSLFSLVLRYPMYTLMIITRIHYQALKLWLKKVPFNKKEFADQEIIKNINKNDKHL